MEAVPFGRGDASFRYPVKPVAETVRRIGVTEVTYYRRRNEYGGLKGDQVKQLKELETENGRLRRWCRT